MNRLLSVVIILISFSYLLSNDQEQYVPIGRAQYPQFESSHNPTSLRPVPTFEFGVLPSSIRTSYYDYMIGSYNNLPMKVQSEAGGGGIYLTYMAQIETSANGGQRRVFYSYLDYDDEYECNNELTEDNINEEYPALDIDPYSGKPFFAWNTSHDPPTNTHHDVSFAWDAYLEHIPGLISEPIKILTYPETNVVNGISITDNEFQSPTVVIGPSPFPDYRRVYILSRNAASHNGYPCGNPIIEWADFTPSNLENGDTLIWNSIHIPEMDNWNVDMINWRQPFYSLVTGINDRIYVAGYHTAYNIAGNTEINEADMDVFSCDNYGQGTWQRYSASSKLPSWNPHTQSGTGPGFFVKENGVPYLDSELFWKIRDSGHLNAVIDNNGLIHYQGMWTLSTSDGTFYPAFNTIKEMVFDIDTHQFSIREVYPIAGTSYDNIYWQPWDTDGNGSVDNYNALSGNPYMYDDWNYSYWDDTVHDGAMRFLYNNIKVTEVNSQGMMASVWQNSWRSRKYHQEDLQYAAYETVPEIYISVSTDNGLIWSEPIVLNSVEIAEFTGNRPMWVYPADQIQFLGTDSEEHTIGRLSLMYYHDNTWGASSIDPPVGENDGGNVKYMKIDIDFPGWIQTIPGIYGTIRRADNHLVIAHATITTAQYSTTSDANGDYSLLLPYGTYSVTVHAPGFDTQTINNIVVSNIQMIHLDFNLTAPIPPITVSGIVLGGNPPVAIQNATVRMIGTQSYTGLTNNLGQFSIPFVLRDNQYQYFVIKQSYNTVTNTINVFDENYDMGTIFMSESSNPPSSVTATLQAGNNSVQINWQLPGQRSIAEKISLEGTKNKSDRNNQADFSQRDRNLVGYMIWRLPSAQQDNEETWTLLGNVPASSAFFIDTAWCSIDAGLYRYAVKAQYSNDIVSAPSFSHAVFRFIYGDLTGTVHDQDLHPIVNTALTLTRVTPNGIDPYMTVTDVNGNYTFSSIWYGDYYLSCSANGYQNISPLNITISANHTLQQNIALSDSLKVPFNVIALNNSDNTLAAISWQSPVGDILRSLNGFKVWLLLESDIENPNAWTLIFGSIDTTFCVDNGWQNVVSGLYKYAVQAIYSGNQLSPAGFSNTIEKPVGNLDPGTSPGITRLISASPNPFASSIKISYELKTNSPATFEIFNISGQHIRSLNGDASKQGVNVISWDGTDEHGDKVTSGIYLYRMMTEGKIYTNKMMLLK